MLIKITKTTILSGDYAREGEVVETDARQAKLLIRMGKAVAVEPAVVEPVVEEVKKAPKKKSAKKSGSKKSSKFKEE